jgi:hypothetical protein
MQALPQWCVTPGTATDKAPRKLDGHLASVTDPTTWSDFDSASRVAIERGWLLGFVFSSSDPFACIDLDVVNRETQQAKGEMIDPAKWSKQEDIDRYVSVVNAFDSYAEVSRSGFGLHILIKGNIGRGRRRDGIEVYSQERFLICTGNVWGGNKPIADCQHILASMLSQMPEPASGTALPLTGDDCVDFSAAQAAASSEGELGRLWRGDWEGRYRSQSEADLALVKLLLPLTDSDLECWRTFQISKLGDRDKAKRADYGRSTMALAKQHLANDAAQLQHGRALAEALFRKPAATFNPGHFRLLCDSELEQLPSLRWLVKRIIPDAGIGAIYGDSGTFKSFLALDLLAHISTGREWFGKRVRAAPSVYVPFEGQGGIPNRIKAWRLAQAKLRYPDALKITAPPEDVRSNISVIVEAMNLREAADRDKLVSTLKELGWAGGVLCIDTLAHASNGIDENSSEMGEMIGIFRDLQLRLGGVILLVHHSGKDQSRGMRGWSGLHAAMDFVVECQRDKLAGNLEAQFVLTKVKDGSDGVSFPFAMQSVVLGFDEDGGTISSLSVIPTTAEVDRSPGTKQTKKGINAIDAETAAADDQFMDQWVRKEVLAGNYPSKNSLKGQLPDIKETYEMTQDRVLAAVERLLAEERLVREPKSPNGNPWLRPVDAPHGVK